MSKVLKLKFPFFHFSGQSVFVCVFVFVFSVCVSENVIYILILFRTLCLWSSQSFTHNVLRSLCPPKFSEINSPDKIYCPKRRMMKGGDVSEENTKKEGWEEIQDEGGAKRSLFKTVER